MCMYIICRLVVRVDELEFIKSVYGWKAVQVKYYIVTSTAAILGGFQHCFGAIIVVQSVQCNSATNSAMVYWCCIVGNTAVVLLCISAINHSSNVA